MALSGLWVKVLFLKLHRTSFPEDCHFREWRKEEETWHQLLKQEPSSIRGNTLMKINKLSVSEGLGAQLLFLCSTIALGLAGFSLKYVLLYEPVGFLGAGFLVNNFRNVYPKF